MEATVSTSAPCRIFQSSLWYCVGPRSLSWGHVISASWQVRRRRRGSSRGCRITTLSVGSVASICLSGRHHRRVRIIGSLLRCSIGPHNLRIAPDRNWRCKMMMVMVRGWRVRWWLLLLLGVVIVMMRRRRMSMRWKISRRRVHWRHDTARVLLPF